MAKQCGDLRMHSRECVRGPGRDSHMKTALMATWVLLACSMPSDLTAQTTQEATAQAKPVGAPHGEATRGAGQRVHALRVTVLSTNVADAGIGEWGFSALVEADGYGILFDTGLIPGHGAQECTGARNRSLGCGRSRPQSLP